MNKISFLIIRCLLLLAAGSPDRRDTFAGLCPFEAGTVSDITSWLPDSPQDRDKIICCHDSCILPAGVWQSWSQTPQRHRRNTCGLNSFKHLEVGWLFSAAIIIMIRVVLTVTPLPYYLVTNTGAAEGWHCPNTRACKNQMRFSKSEFLRERQSRYKNMVYSLFVFWLDAENWWVWQSWCFGCTPEGQDVRNENLQFHLLKN